MALIYLDTSVIVKRYRREQGNDFIDALFQNPFHTNTFYTSILSVLELTAAVMRLISGAQLADETGQEILR
jgi:predicted nucleic acid-binding protein